MIDEYFDDLDIKSSKKNSEKADIKDFDISTGRYNKTKMKVEIVEYEIKD
ncbi:MAG: hypothetical protein SVO01_08335 [Thermotogota bacterium]|nr:hypothetical protein [Thermotogota bacterium]